MSSPNALLAQLRDILKELYPTIESAIIVVDGAEIPRANIPFSSAASQNWHAILREAHNRRKVLALVDVALQDFDRDDLRAIREAYRAAFLASVTAAGPVRDQPPRQTDPPAAPTTVDLAIVTALPEELEPVLSLIGGREHWESFMLDKFIHYRAQFTGGSRPLNVVACSLWKMGGDPTTAQIIRLKQLRPRLIVMTGICAGWQEKDIHLGDVMVADRALHGGEGKVTDTGLLRDIHTYQPPPWLLGLLKDFEHNRQWVNTITTPRPHTLRFQAEWLLCQLATRGPAFPSSEADWSDIKANNIDYPRVRKLLLDKKYITSTGKLTRQAEKRLTELRRQHYGQLVPTPDRPEPTVHYKAFASSEAVVAAPNPFTDLSKSVRGIGALEMEVASLLAAALEIGVPAFAVKGVSDYGIPDKDDAFHTYAAEASARWMFAFSCHYGHLVP
jgi:nucleoside phosphorylase